MPISPRSSSRVIVGDVDAVERDPAAVELVEPHEQVDQRGLAGAGRADDRDGLAGLDRQRQVLDQRLVGLVAEARRARTRPGRAPGRAAPARPGRAPAPSASSSSNTRSAEATPDCSRLAMDATWVSGWVNCREYWMNACTSPSDIAPGRDPQAADDGDQHVVEVADEHHRRQDHAGDELRPEARRRTAPRCARAKASRRPPRCRPKTLTSACPVYISSMCALSWPVCAHCCDELRLRALADLRGDDDRQRHRDQRDHARAAARSRTSSPARRRPSAAR